MPAGEYRIAARSTGPTGAASIAVETVTIDGDDVANLVMSLQPTITIGGLIVFRGDSSPPVLGRSTELVPLTLLLGTNAIPTTSLQIDGVRFTVDVRMPGRVRMGGLSWGFENPSAAGGSSPSSQTASSSWMLRST